MVVGCCVGLCFFFDRFFDRIERDFVFKYEGIMMCVSDILKVKGNMLFMVMFDKLLCEVVDMMVEYDIGLFVVMEYGDFVGMLMFCEIILCLYVNGGVIGDV